MVSADRLLDLDGVDDHGGLGPVKTVSRDLGDLIDDLLALGIGHLTEDRVMTVQMRRRGHGDEELRAVRPRAGIRHRQEIGLVEDEIGVELIFEGVARAATAIALGVAALDHETIDHAMEDETVVKMAGGLLPGGDIGVFLGPVGQADEIRHCQGGLVIEQRDLHVAMVTG